MGEIGRSSFKQTFSKKETGDVRRVQIRRKISADRSVDLVFIYRSSVSCRYVVLTRSGLAEDGGGSPSPFFLFL